MVLDRWIQSVRRRGRLRVVAFRSFGTADHAVVRGRVLANGPTSASVEGESTRTAMRRMTNRFLSREVAGVAVEVELAATKAVGMTDAEGYFAVDLHELSAGRSPTHWAAATIRLVDGPPGESWPTEVMLIDTSINRIVTSDIDDTVLENAGGDIVGTVVATVTGSARTRRPIAGTPALYRSMTHDGDVPLFFVSSSPWNIYDFLVAFLDRNGFPPAPLILRDFGFNRDTLGRGRAHGDHKISSIEGILDAFPNATAVLLGDSSQGDATAFRDIAERYPGRIDGAYIRDVGDPVRAVLRRQRHRGVGDQ